ncbi:molybdopterin-binding/glycosyltransferase family 2 protein, partial [Aquisalimonas sp.]
MRFGKCPLAEAEGGLLVHTVNVAGKRWSKGRQLSADDVAQLQAEGIDGVTVAHLDPDDTHEDMVADALARAMAGEGVEVGRAFTGRCNLYAADDGVSALDSARLTTFNHIDEALTVATVPPFEQVHAGQMLATIKVIPFAVPAALLERALEHLDKPAIRVARYHRRRFGLLLTRLPALKESLLEKGEKGIRQRLTGLGCELAMVRQCEHDEGAITEALKEMAGAPLDGILVLAASAITDRRDVIPAALTAAGGDIERFGMPVDPGNLLLLGRLSTLPVVGLPGCARSPKINGLDWVLRRLATDLPVNAGVIAGMGIGGLLQDTSERPQTREPATRTAQRKPRVAAVLLAAGHSRRMGEVNKLLASWQDKALIQHSVDNALASQASPVYVITGHEGDRVAGALTGRDVVVVHNPEHAEGLASSLRAAVRALPDTVDGMLVCLGDMPQVAPAHLDQLIAAFSPQEGRAACIPTYQGKRGNPALLGRQLFP